MSSCVNGTYGEIGPLANITIAGMKKGPNGCSMNYGGQADHGSDLNMNYRNGVVYITGMEEFTTNGAFEKAMALKLS